MQKVHQALLIKERHQDHNRLSQLLNNFLNNIKVCKDHRLLITFRQCKDLQELLNRVKIDSVFNLIIILINKFNPLPLLQDS
jgi:hypothetical protein